MRPQADLIEEVVLVGGREIVVLRPREAEALLDERRFADDEFLPYWAELWPSGMLLAETVIGRALRGRRVLDLGCGLALPAIAAALAGGRVTASDWSAAAVELAEANAARNGVVVEPLVCSWQEPAGLLARAPWELVLAADLLYEARNVELLSALLPELTGGHGEVWLADPGRRHAEVFLARAAADGWDPRPLRSSRSPRVTVHRLRPPPPGDR